MGIGCNKLKLTGSDAEDAHHLVSPDRPGSRLVEEEMEVVP